MSEIAQTPEPSYYAVIFSSHRTSEDQDCAAMAQEMVELAVSQPGFLGIEPARESLLWGRFFKYPFRWYFRGLGEAFIGGGADKSCGGD